jgi:hypothetical protein
MKRIFSLALLVIIYSFSVAQDKPGFQFASEKEARQMINLIVEVVGLKPNFEIKSGLVDNAAAVIYNGKRYILYNPVFISQIKNAVKTDWGGLSILAHEVGHHLNGHTLLGSGSTPPVELEADEFSGFVLRKLGASLEESQVAMRLISDVRGSATHPGRTKRLAAIQTGWNRAEIQISSASKPKLPLPDSRTPDTREKVVSARYVFPAKFISYNVHLNALAGETFHITTQNNLVRVTRSGYQLIGKLIQTDRSFYLAFTAKQKLRLNSKGYLLNDGGEKLGRVTRPFRFHS